MTLEGGEHVQGKTDIVMGHRDNPLTWEQLREKFEGLAEPILGKEKCATLYELGRNFLQPGSIEKISAVLAVE